MFEFADSFPFIEIVISIYILNMWNAFGKRGGVKIDNFSSPLLDESEERRIILLGRIGSGKSLVGNAILGKAVFKSRRGFSAVTKTCDFSSVVRNRKRYIIFDTPGYGSFTEDGSKVFEELKRCLYVISPGFHAIVLVMSLAQRYTHKDWTILNEFRRLLGENSYAHTILIFTHVEGSELHSVIEESEEVNKLAKSCGDRYLSFGYTKFVEDAVVAEFEHMLENLILMNRSANYTHPFSDKVFEIICKDAADIRKADDSFSYETSIKKARMDAFRGRSPRDREIVALDSMHYAGCAIL